MKLVIVQKVSHVVENQRRNNNMKKIICCILLSVCLCFTLVGCDITEETGTMDKGSIQD